MKHITAHVFRQPFEIHLLEKIHNIRMVQELMGHSNVDTSMIYTYGLSKSGHGIKSRLDNI
jgi:site-specific recombinase XerC